MLHHNNCFSIFVLFTPLALNMKAKVVSDSMLSRLEPYHLSYLKESLQLDEIEVLADGGKDSQFLLSHKSDLVACLRTEACDLVLISAGQNDINHLVLGGSVLSVADEVASRIIGHLSLLGSNFPQTCFVFLPLTARAVCSKRTRHGESLKQSYIDKVNHVIRRVSSRLSTFSMSNVNIVDGESLFSSPLVGCDGIHFSSQGTDKYLAHCMVEIKSMKPN